VFPGVLVVTNARAYYHYTRGCGCSGARHSLRPLNEEGGTSRQSLGHFQPREREAVFVRDDAKNARGRTVNDACAATTVVVPASSRDPWSPAVNWQRCVDSVFQPHLHGVWVPAQGRDDSGEAVAW